MIELITRSLGLTHTQGLKHLRSPGGRKKGEWEEWEEEGSKREGDEEKEEKKSRRGKQQSREELAWKPVEAEIPWSGGLRCSTLWRKECEDEGKAEFSNQVSDDLRKERSWRPQDSDLTNKICRKEQGTEPSHCFLDCHCQLLSASQPILAASDAGILPNSHFSSRHPPHPHFSPAGPS